MRCLIAIAMLTALTAGCTSAPQPTRAIDAYLEYDFADARDHLRDRADGPANDDILLDNLRLGMAALADGSLDEAERALRRAFDLLSTAGLNADRTTAAVLLNDGVLIWKGEPFEQALAYYEVAALYAVKGDWENARAAAANSLFRLTDFGADQTTRTIASRAARDDDYLDEGYTAVETNFALGFLMQAIGEDQSGGDGDRLYDAAIEIDPRLSEIASTLRTRDFDTLLLIDWGLGPRKVAFGPDESLTRFQPREQRLEPISVTSGNQAGDYPAVCDVNALAGDHRWNNLEDIRRAKSLIGDGLVIGGALTISNSEKTESQLIGAGLMLAGLISKANARADTRHLEFTPHAVYLVPLRLGETSDVTIRDATGGVIALADVAPGTTDRPRTIYLRHLGPHVSPPPWLTSAGPRPDDAPLAPDSIGDLERRWGSARNMKPAGGVADDTDPPTEEIDS